MKNKLNELMAELGQTAIAIKQEKQKLANQEKNYNALEAQVILLQTMQKRGDSTAAPKSTKDQEQTP
jgi:uncharacterized membrane protein YgaE (UPF0421/DUF939 family)